MDTKLFKIIKIYGVDSIPLRYEEFSDMQVFGQVFISLKRGGAFYNELTYGTADTEKLPGGAVFKGLHCTQYGGQFLFKMAKKDGR